MAGNHHDVAGAGVVRGGGGHGAVAGLAVAARIVTLGISLLLANGALWFARQPQHSARRRFELTFAAWLWMGVQAGCLLWFVLAE
ncbi:MAG: hypothetical protein WCY72_08020 [Lysobacteraceae bacterium]